jgi:hypothetical protein
MNPMKENIRKSWWQTMTGVITGITALVTTITGLILALHTAGLIGNSAHPPSVLVTKGNPPETGAEEPARRPKHQKTPPGPPQRKHADSPSMERAGLWEDEQPTPKAMIIAAEAADRFSIHSVINLLNSEATPPRTKQLVIEILDAAISTTKDCEHLRAVNTELLHTQLAHANSEAASDDAFHENMDRSEILFECLRTNSERGQKIVSTVAALTPDTSPKGLLHVDAPDPLISQPVVAGPVDTRAIAKAMRALGQDEIIVRK